MAIEALDTQQTFEACFDATQHGDGAPRSPRPDLTHNHRFSLDQIEEAYDLFGNQREGVVKVGLTP